MAVGDLPGKSLHKPQLLDIKKTEDWDQKGEGNLQGRGDAKRGAPAPKSNAQKH